MLTDKQIAEALDLIDDRYHGVITKYLQKVGKTVNEIGHLNQSSINLLIQLRRMGVDVRTIEKELQKATRLTKQDIKKLYRKAAQEANTDARFSYVSKGVEPNSVRWESLVENIWKQTAGVMDNLANSSVITENYRAVIDDAVQAVTMGAGDYNSAIRDAVKQIGRAGIQVEYEATYLATDGQLKHRKRRLDSAVRQNVLDGIRQVQQKAQELIGEEIGADGVDITAHPNSAPDHEPVQGRRFDMANFRRMQSGQDFDDVDGNHYEGFERPVTQWRCRHLIYYILLGVTRRMYTDEQLRSWEQKNRKGCIIDGKKYTGYEATQLMRNLETEIRRQKDTAILAKVSGDDVLRRECQSNINKLTLKYQSVAEAAGLRTQFQNTAVDGFKAVEPNKIADSGISETSPRVKKKVSFAVDWDAVQNPTYEKKYKKLSDASEVNRAALVRAKWALSNRDGKKTEELYALDMHDGTEISRITDQQHDFGVQRTAEFDRSIGAAVKRGTSILLIHNHPGGSPPSIGDINALLGIKNGQGITVGHNGTVYRYSAPREKIPQIDFDVAIRKYKEYTYDTAYKKALADLAMLYGFEFDEL